MVQIRQYLPQHMFGKRIEEIENWVGGKFKPRASPA